MAARQQTYENTLDQQKAKLDAAKAAGSNAANMFGATQKYEQAGLESRNNLVRDLLTPTTKTQQPVTVNVNGTTGSTTTPAAGTSGSNAASTIGQVAGAAKAGSELWNLGSKAAPYVKSAWEWITSDEDEKTSKKKMSDDEICKILDGLAPMEYKYKSRAIDKGSPKGKVVGIMAQQVEKTPASDMVGEDEDGVKMLDGQKAISLALASLSSLNSRMKKMEGK